MDYLKRARELSGQIVEDRRTFHSHPEIGCEVPHTSAYIREKLEEMGLEVSACGRWGLTAVIGKKTEGPVLLLRADIDALPMREESGLPFASRFPGLAHCCGHDNHAAMVLGAARMLKENEDALAGRVKLMFQPGEESGNGCQEMLDAGILRDPAPDACLGMHVDAASPLGWINWGEGAVFCSNDVFALTVKGRSCHGARPHQGKDAINCAAHLVLALESLIAREADPSQTDILTVCSIESDAKAFNVFPESVRLKGSLRTYDDGQRTYLLERLKEVCEYTARTFGCACDVELDAGMNAVILDNAMEEEIKGYITATLGEEITMAPAPIRKMGSDDVACLTARLPSAYFFLGAGIDRETPYPYGQHNTKVVFNEACLPLGAAALAGCAENWLKNHAK